MTYTVLKVVIVKYVFKLMITKYLTIELRKLVFSCGSNVWCLRLVKAKRNILKEKAGIKSVWGFILIRAYT